METLADYIHDWQGEISYPPVKLQDETLRDGLQAPNVSHPTLEQKQTLLHLMDELGIDGADIGFPGSGERHISDVVGLAKYKQQNNLGINLSCAGRTIEADVLPIIYASELAGEPFEVDLFIGSSEIRKLAQNWNLDDMKKKVEQSITLAVKEGLPVMFVTEDSTRASRETIIALHEVAINAGAKRICIADTVGFATDINTTNLIRFYKQEIVKDRDIKLDWHGHRDRYFAESNALIAAREGVDRVHGTALGVGERCGNTIMEALLVNFKIEGIKDNDISRLMEYSNFASQILKRPIPENAPIIGVEAFNTASGVHADAILKSYLQGRPDLAGLVYAPFNPGIIGRSVDVRVGPMSGRSNIILALKRLDIEQNDDLIESLYEIAKRSNQILSDRELRSHATRLRKELQVKR